MNMNRIMFVARLLLLMPTVTGRAFGAGNGRDKNSVTAVVQRGSSRSFHNQTSPPSVQRRDRGYYNSLAPWDTPEIHVITCAAIFPNSMASSSQGRHGISRSAKPNASSAYRFRRGSSNSSFRGSLLGLPVASHQLQCSYTSCSCPPDPLLLYCDLTYVPKLSLEIRDLCIIGGKLYEIEQRDFFHNATHIKGLQLQKCSIVSISSDALSCMKRLTKLDLSYNFISKFPESCDASGKSFFPRLSSLDLSKNAIESLSVLRDAEAVCFPRLQYLDLSYNDLISLERKMFSTVRFPMLQQLRLIQSLGSRDLFPVLNDAAFESQSLKELSLTHNDFESTGSVLLSGCPNLTKLDLSYTPLNSMLGIIRDLGSLEVLNLESCGIRQISSDTFKTLKSLRSLTLSDNNLVSLPDGAFDDLNELRVLELDGNQISLIREASFNPETRQRLQLLDLSGNPFSCSCDILWFQNWFKIHPALFHPYFPDYVDTSYYTYYCYNVPDKKLRDFSIPDQACLLTQETSIFISITITILISTVTTISLLYRYRWHIRLVLYEAFRGQREDRQRRFREQHFQYDVFVSYDSEDFDWVQQHLMPELEGLMGLRLCLHERDFIPGRNIVDNIVECVESSKKIMMLFSIDFAKSPWCQFELTLCLTHVMEHGDDLLVVLLRDIPARELTPAMMAVMKTTTYIEWGNEPEARDSFWRRLGISLNEILPI